MVINMCRGNGITQNALAKDLKVENNNFFYVVRSLECRGLIVRQPAVVKMKDVSVTTNMLYLYRHAKHLGVQQRFEINEECVEETDIRGDGFDGESSSKVLVRDYLPAIKAICDKLEKANDKVNSFFVLLFKVFLILPVMIMKYDDFCVIEGPCHFRYQTGSWLQWN